MKKIIAILLCLVFCFGFLTGCSKGKTRSFVYYISEIPTVLDPQLAQTPAQITAVTNMFEGLFRKNLDGEIETAAAESYAVSEDGLTYTIKLKEGLTYNYGYNKAKNAYVAASEEYPAIRLSANDFVFALQRVFMPQTASPWADTLSAIDGAKQVLSGSPVTSLSAYATNDTTLVIKLSYPDPEFITKLCCAGAMPCNEQFFNFTSGAYGLRGNTAAANILGNGEYMLTVWDDTDGITLRRQVSGNKLINRIRLVTQEQPQIINSDDAPVSMPTAAERLANGESNGEILMAEEHGAFSETPFCTTTWALCINAQKPYFQNDNIRTGIANCTIQSKIAPISTSLTAAEGLIPTSVTLFDQSYRDYAGNVISAPNNGADAYKLGIAQLYEAGTIKAQKLSGVVLLIPDNDIYADFATQLSQCWQRDLAAFFAIERVSQTELLNRVKSGDYDLAFCPIYASENDVFSMLSFFTADSQNNLTGYTPVDFSDTMQKIKNTASMQSRATLYVQAEKQLLLGHSIVPLCFETSYFATNGVKNVVVNPFGPVLDFKWAEIE